MSLFLLVVVGRSPEVVGGGIGKFDNHVVVMGKLRLYLICTLLCLPTVYPVVWTYGSGRCGGSVTTRHNLSQCADAVRGREKTH